LSINIPFDFLTTSVWNISHCKKTSASCYRTCTQVFIRSIHYSRQILKKLEFTRQIFESNQYQISWKFVQRKPSCNMRTDGWAEGHDKAKCRLSPFLKVPKRKIWVKIVVKIYRWKIKHLNVSQRASIRIKNSNNAGCT
jgi:hypothetical protein